MILQTPPGKLLKTALGKFSDSTGDICILPGNILILRWGMLRLPGVSSLFSVDGRSTLLGESIADLLIFASPS